MLAAVNIITKDRFKSISAAFTLVELVVVIVVIGILSTIGVVSYSIVQVNTRDSQRSSQASVITEALETYYSVNGEYPDCTTMTSSSANVAKTLPELSPSTLTAPGASSGTNSIVCSEPNITNFGYIGGSTGYKLEYRSERTDSLITVVSRHSPVLIPQPSTVPIVDISSSSTIVSASITNAPSITCSTGTVQYAMRHQLNDGTWSAYSNWSNDPLAVTDSLTSVEGTKYNFQARAHCFATKASFSDDKLNSATSYITAIATPATPVVTANTSGSYTTWSWPTIACSAGNIRYQYDYNTSSGYNSGWVATNTTALTFTTASAGTYTVAVQAQCVNSYTASPWSSSSASSNVSYTRVFYAITLTAGAGGSVSGGGYYEANITITITATANSGYRFVSWSDGNTSANRVIAVTGNASYGANFAPNSFTVTVAASAGGTASGGGTYTSGSTITLASSVNAGYLFNGWACSDGNTNANASFNYTVTSNVTCTANFIAVIASTVSQGDSYGGYASIGGFGWEETKTNSRKGGNVTVTFSKTLYVSNMHVDTTTTGNPSGYIYFRWDSGSWGGNNQNQDHMGVNTVRDFAMDPSKPMTFLSVIGQTTAQWGAYLDMVITLTLSNGVSVVL
jgi:uncharacterized repeat protein (TIGR02543 family)/prepilin-type N-terminal cleavage/methylation domain-containing protein